MNGLVIDKIEKVCHGLPPTRSFWKSLTAGTYTDRKEVLSWLNDIQNKICPSFTPGIAYLNGKALFPLSLFDALWRTLIVGIDHKNLPFCDDKIYGRELFDAFLALLHHTMSSQGDSPRIETFNRQLLGKAKICVQALDRLSNSTVFRTSQGYVGRGPPLLEKGDHFCVFLEGRTPFVIRKTRSALFGILYTYRLVVECYVEGLMRKGPFDTKPWWREGMMRKEALDVKPRRWRMIIPE